MAMPRQQPAEEHTRPAATDDEARQGKPEGVVRYVLGISLGLAIVAMIVVYVTILA